MQTLRLIVPCPEVHFLHLLVIVLPAVTERVFVLAVRVYLIPKGIVLIGLDDLALLICQLHDIPMWVGHVVLFLRVVPFVRIDKVTAVTSSVSSFLFYLKCTLAIHSKNFHSRLDF